MLKIKDGVDLKELEKFGFENAETEWYFDFIEYSQNEHSYLCIAENDRKIEIGYVQYEHIYKEMLDKIYDLIQAGLVEKIEKESK